MSFSTAFRTALVAAVVAFPVGVSAQPANLPTPDSTAFEIEQSDGESVVAHKQSGGQCPMKLGEIPLARTHNLRPGDGTNVGCQYDLTGEDGLSRVSAYIYTVRGADAAGEFQGAKAAIRQVSERTPITVTEKPELGQKCKRALSLALTLAAAQRSPDTSFELVFDLTTYHYDIPAMRGNPARSETSLLSVYEAGDWMVKTRINIPGDSDADADKVCDLALEWNLTQADAISHTKSAVPAGGDAS